MTRSLLVAVVLIGCGPASTTQPVAGESCSSSEFGKGICSADGEQIVCSRTCNGPTCEPYRWERTPCPLCRKGAKPEDVLRREGDSLYCE